MIGNAKLIDAAQRREIDRACELDACWQPELCLSALKCLNSPARPADLQPPHVRGPSDDARTLAALAAYQDALRQSRTWRNAVRAALAAADAVDPLRTPDLLTVHPEEEWHEDHGPVLWHFMGEHGEICEAPIVAGSLEELEQRQPWPGYYSHWSHLPPMPKFPSRSLMLAPPGSLICDVENIDPGPPLAPTW